MMIFLGGGDKRILEVKTDFKERAKPKVGSKDNIKFQPGEISLSIARLNSREFILKLTIFIFFKGGGDVKVSLINKKRLLSFLRHEIFEMEKDLEISVMKLHA